MAKTSLSGFPEWLPAGRIVEQHVVDELRRVFELHGYSSIETRAVEPLTELLRKGETSKEVYLLQRLQEEKEESEARKLGLHFDLTVPFARYVLENAGKLAFPFKRYQIQKVWRGERPQDGRFREFLQADIDVIGDGTLPFHYEVEVALVIAAALSALPIPPVVVHVNNRKLLQGFAEGIGITDIEATLRGLDKLDKIGATGVERELAAAGIAAKQCQHLLKLAAITGFDAAQLRSQVGELGELTELAQTGLDELCAILDAAGQRTPGVVMADLKIARGLDYYTGTVYETTVSGHEDLGSICSGGRYDSLASDGKRTYPGVGLSIGVSRLISRLLSQDLVEVSRPVPTAVLVAVNNEDDRAVSEEVAAQLRRRGINCDVAPVAARFGRQIRFADRRGIPYVWFPGAAEGGDAVKDIRSGEQVAAEAATWELPAADRHPVVTAR